MRAVLARQLAILGSMKTNARSENTGRTNTEGTTTKKETKSMKTRKYIIYSTDFQYKKEKFRLNKTALFTWIAVIVITVVFWSGVATVYKEDYIPRAVAKLHYHKEQFLANHKALQKKLSCFRNSLSGA